MKKILAIFLAIIGIGVVASFTVKSNPELAFWNNTEQRDDWIKYIEEDKDLSEKLTYKSNTEYFYNRYTLSMSDGLNGTYSNNGLYGYQKEYDERNEWVAIDFLGSTNFDSDLIIINKTKLYAQTGIDVLNLVSVHDLNPDDQKTIEYGDYLFLIDLRSLTSDGSCFEGFFFQNNKNGGAFTEDFLKKPFTERVQIMDSCIQCYNLALDSDLRTASDGTKEKYYSSITTPTYSQVSIENSSSTNESTEQTSTTN